MKHTKYIYILHISCDVSLSEFNIKTPLSGAAILWTVKKKKKGETNQQKVQRNNNTSKNV